MRKASALTVVALAALSAAGDCTGGSVVIPGKGGLDGVLAFEAPDDLFFTTNIGVGSVFNVVARPGASTDDKDILVGDVDVGTSNAGVMSVEPLGTDDDGAFTFRVTVVGGGNARLAVTKGDRVIDRMDLGAVPVGTTSLVDGTLLGLSGIDVSLPARMSLIDNRDVSIAVAAVDRCGNGVIDVGASRLRIEPIANGVGADDVAVVEYIGLTGFTVTPVAAGADFVIVLETPGLDPLRYRVDAVDASNVDEIEIAIATADGDSSTALAWGRAYADGIEVIGLEYSWSGDQPRLSFSVFEGPATTVTIGALATDEAGNPIDSPATMYADALGETAELDLLTVSSSSLVAARAAGPVRDNEPKIDNDETSSGGCGESTSRVCDPLALLLPAIGLRRLKRRRRQQR